MNKILRMLGLIVALSVFAAIALCGCSIEDPGDIVVSTQDADSNNEVYIQTIGTTESTVSDLNTIDELVMVDQDGIKVTAKEYVEDSFWGEGIKVLVENTTDKNICVSCNAVIVNNYMISEFFACEVAAGKKSNETIYLLSTELEAAGIENIGQVELYFNVYNSDTFDTLFETECITVQTSGFADMDVTPNDGGLELYNQNGIRIVGKVVDEDSFWGSAVLLYLENNCGKNVIVSCENMSINGFMVDGYLYSEIYDGKMAIDEIIILQTDLDENDIDKVEEIELVFHVFDVDTYKTIAETDPITFSVS